MKYRVNFGDGGVTPQTFATQRDAERWITASKQQGSDPYAGQYFVEFWDPIIGWLAASAKKTKRAHATKREPYVITEQQARSMPRYDFIAHWLETVTRNKEMRDLAMGKRVRRRGGRWQILYRNGLVEYETPDTDRLFDYARRGALNWHIRNAEEFRALAYQRSA